MGSGIGEVAAEPIGEIGRDGSPFSGLRQICRSFAMAIRLKATGNQTDPRCFFQHPPQHPIPTKPTA